MLLGKRRSGIFARAGLHRRVRLLTRMAFFGLGSLLLDSAILHRSASIGFFLASHALSRRIQARVRPPITIPAAVVAPHGASAATTGGKPATSRLGGLNVILIHGTPVVAVAITILWSAFELLFGDADPIAAKRLIIG